MPETKLTLEQAEYVRHLIGNKLFALETNLQQSMKYPTDYTLREAMQRSVDQIKKILEGL